MHAIEPSGQAVQEPLFRACNIGKSFHGVRVLEDISLAIGYGEVVALLGENGAGKSTFSSIVAGAQGPSKGSMFLAGQPYAPGGPAEAMALGVNMIHQEIHLLPELSVAENVFLGHLPTRGGLVDRGHMYRETEKQLQRLGLDISPDTLVGQLKIAAQQLVEIARALTLNSRLLILDEPTAALGKEETDLLFRQIETLKGQGVSFIYISHRMDEIARIADKVVVMRDGCLLARHDSGAADVGLLVSQMVGRSIERLFPALPEPTEELVLRVERLSDRAGRFADISFAVRAGEIFGIAGIVGAGRTEVVQAIAGLSPLAAGSVRVAEQVLPGNDVAAAIRAGVVLIPEDRKAEGVVLGQTIAENLAYCNLDRLSACGVMDNGRVMAFALERIAALGIKGQARQTLDKLSGGNQQKVVIAKWVARGPKVIILDEPTRGIDMGARAAIYELIVALARTGVSVIVVSSDLDEVIGLSHRVMVMARGRAQGVLQGRQIAPDRIMTLATA
ncbi:sugar ABC transporter ATP-binding protein [Pseudomonas gingeri]|uniref:sugar ABC transporter ATP-binding protein n=1 Tax=Pseudomonas gingeri TaxID=117681 RepID=UPI0015A46FC8|nr:sugar ABC transporter ATP-binding protein [Pseudomonas gingeri]NVZ60604.1 sugar ABC transporter ATP-binding protein [Pseudomonas gingeri]NVZ77187.1 sugar ABC transporter ATP-binding protein [Pseudomonas gingeri]